MVSEKLREKMEAAGFRIKTFKSEHIKEISGEFKNLMENGLLDGKLYSDYLKGFNYDYDNVLKNAKSVIVIASPQNKSLAEFSYEGGKFSAVIPPTYIYSDITERVKAILDNIFAENGYSCAEISLPLKLLAVRSGLGKYGRNNVCYIPGLGSFFRLSVFITNCDFEEDSWGETKAMENCGGCTACIESCPTGAIDRERFLIRAHRCITYLNESESPMPGWVKPEWHNALIGCMKCISTCPYNRKFIDIVDERIIFSKEETKLILEINTFSDLPLETRNKVTRIGLNNSFSIMPRNIRLLIDSNRS